MFFHLYGNECWTIFPRMRKEKVTDILVLHNDIENVWDEASMQQGTLQNGNK